MDSEFSRLKEIANGAKAVDKPMVAAMALRLRQDELPGEVRSMRLKWLVLSEPPGGALAERGIATVGDFITRTGRELTEGLGIPRAAVDEARQRLLGYGIRTIENPPLGR